MSEVVAGRRLRGLPSRALVTAVVAALCLIGLALRLHRLGDADIWWDEGWSVWLARMPVLQLAERTAYDTNPPLYYALLHCWRLLVGESEYALRLLSVLGGVVAVAATHRLARECCRKTAGPIAAALVAVSPFMLLWSQQTRMYSWATALGLLSAALALRLWRENRGGLGYVLVTLALLHTHTLAVLFPLLQNLMWLPQRRSARRWIVVQVAMVLGMVPWLLVFLARTPTWSVHDPVGPGIYLSYYWSALMRGTSVYLEAHAATLLAALACFLLCLLIGLVRARSSERLSLAQVAVAALVPPLAVFVLSQPRSFLYTPRPEVRYLNPFAPAVYLLWALGLEAAWRTRRPLGAGLTALTLALLALALPGYYQERVPRDDYRSMAATLATYAAPDDLILLHTDSDWPAFVYHHRGVWQGVPNDVAWEAASAVGFLGQFLPERRVAWLVLTPDALRADPGQAVPAELERWCREGTCLTSRWRFDGGELVRFSRGVPLPEPSLAPARASAGGFEGLWWPYRRARAHSQWRLYAWWSGAQAPPTLRLTGEQGEALVAAPVAEGSGERVRLEYRFALGEPGRYRLETDSGEALLPLEVVAAGPAEDWQGEDSRPVAVTFASSFVLEAASTSAATVTAGDHLCVRLEWRARQPADESYTVFVHLVGETWNAAQGNFLWGQHDGLPAEGSRPTTSWSEGETVSDVHCFLVDPSAPPGEYLLEAGLYDGLTGARLAVTAGGEGDRAMVGDVRVVEPD